MNLQFIEEMVGGGWLITAAATALTLPMRKSRRWVFLLVPTLAYPLSLLWWHLWMNAGWPGPIGLLHHAISGLDGESSYDATHLEMLVVLFLMLPVSFLFLSRFKHQRLKSNSSACSTATA